jgi:DNA invertase Pin-like site-specific DNA recombinase
MVTSSLIKDGMQRAKSEGKQIGRPPIKEATVNKIILLLKKGLTYRKIAKQIGCGAATVQRVKGRYKQEFMEQ